MLSKILSRAAAVLVLVLGSGTVQGEVSVGQPAPDFRLQDQNGKWHTLADHRGQWVALYFYPKDQTPGCTKQACAFRDNIFAFEELGATILGISLDDVKSHEEFARKYSLPFSILADTGGETAKAYGVLKDFGVMKLASRESFLIDPTGKVVKHYEKVDAEKNSAEILADLKALGARKAS
jgi:peroxiredoxin Q/BCP